MAAVRRNWLFGMAIVLGPSLVFLGLVVGGLKVFGDSRLRSLKPSDRQRVVTAGDLELAVDPKREFLQKTVHDNGSLRLTYRYPNELLPEDSTSVECLLVRALDDVAAAKALDGVEYEVRRALDPKPGMLSLGDDPRAGLLLKSGHPVGTFFATRRGRFVFVLRVTGKVHEPQELARVIEPKLQRLTELSDG